MRRSYQFISGMVVMGVIGLLMTTVLAVSGQVSYDKAGIIMFDKTKVGVGETLTAPNGQEIPGVITYQDDADGVTNYLPVRKVAEWFDAPVSWDSKTNSVILGNRTCGVSVEVGKNSTDLELKETPELGATAGFFEEVGTPKADVINKPNTIICLDNAKIQSNTGIGQQFSCRSGWTLVVTVTNNGENDQVMNVSRPITISKGSCEPFHSLKIAPGKTLTRAFHLSEDASELTRILDISVNGGGTPSLTDITMSVKICEP